MSISEAPPEMVLAAAAAIRASNPEGAAETAEVAVMAARAADPALKTARTLTTTFHERFSDTPLPSILVALMISLDSALP